MTGVLNDKCSDGHLFGMTKILLYKYFIRKYYFAPIIFQVFLKHPPGHKESIGILGDQIGTREGLEKRGQTDTRTSANYYMDYDFTFFSFLGKFSKYYQFSLH